MSATDKVERALTIGNTLAIVGTTFYFYRAITNIQANLVRVTESLMSTIAAVEEMKSNNEKLEALTTSVKKLDANIRNVNNSLADHLDGEDFQLFLDQFETIIKKMNENGIDVDNVINPPSPPPPPRRHHSRDHKHSKHSKHDEVKEQPKRSKGVRFSGTHRPPQQSDESSSSDEEVIDPRRVMVDFRNGRTTSRRDTRDNRR